MRILHAIRSVNPKNGGPVEGIKQLSGTLHRTRNFHVEVASIDQANAPYLHGFPLPVHALGPGHLTYGFSSRFVPWLRQNARRFDIVVVNGIWQYHSLATRLALHRSSTPYVVFTHGMLDPWFKRRYPLKHLKKWMYWPWAEYRVLRDAAGVFFTCEEERILARESFWLYRCNEVVVNYGTAGAKGDPAAQLVSVYDRWPHLLGKRIVLFMGRLHPKKGCDLVIQAFAQILGKHPDWHLVFAGPDQVGWQAKLAAMAEKAGISGQLTWAGMLQGDLKWGMIRASEVFLLPSHQENFGIVVAEALSCGVPVLISNKVNIWREVERHGAGIAAEDDMAGTSSLLQTWVDIPADRKTAMRVQARSCFEKQFEITQACGSFYDALVAAT